MTMKTEKKGKSRKLKSGVGLLSKISPVAVIPVKMVCPVHTGIRVTSMGPDFVYLSWREDFDNECFDEKRLELGKRGALFLVEALMDAVDPGWATTQCGKKILGKEKAV